MFEIFIYLKMLSINKPSIKHEKNYKFFIQQSKYSIEAILIIELIALVLLFFS